MGSTTIQARHGEDAYPIGRFILERARALGMKRTELVRRLGYQHIGNGHRALVEMLTTGTIPPQIGKHLTDALQMDGAIVAAVMEATARQQRDEASQRILSQEAAYKAAFQPHLRCETERAVPDHFLSPRCSQARG